MRRIISTDDKRRSCGGESGHADQLEVEQRTVKE